MSNMHEHYFKGGYLAHEDGVSLVAAGGMVSILAGNIFRIDDIEDFVESFVAAAESTVTSTDVCNYIFATLQPVDLYYHCADSAEADLAAYLKQAA